MATRQRKRVFNLPRTIWWEKGKVCLIDQTYLPSRLKIIKVSTYRQIIRCIKEMRVRGAPAIGVAAAFGLALAGFKIQRRGKNFLRELRKVAEEIKKSRPTAVNLAWSLERILKNTSSAEEVLREAQKMAEEDEITNRKIGQRGSALIPPKATILTHCNAGSLATVYFGTALGVIYAAWLAGKKIKVVVDETRPRFQGASLTAWELHYLKIPFTLITDSMAAFYCQQKKVDFILVGADRIIAKTGEVFNKIGTYALAIIAKEHRIPFYVAAPFSTIDFKTKTGKKVTIEQRSPEEVTKIRGEQISPPGIEVFNPAFDLTPARYITRIVTERGIFKPEELNALKAKNSNSLSQQENLCPG